MLFSLNSDFKLFRVVNKSCLDICVNVPQAKFNELYTDLFSSMLLLMFVDIDIVNNEKKIILRSFEQPSIACPAFLSANWIMSLCTGALAAVYHVIVQSHPCDI